MNYNDGKWHGWNGGECPVHPETVVEVVGGWGSARSTSAHERNVTWRNVCAFRVIKEHKEPREFWIELNANGTICATYAEKKKQWESTRLIHVREVTE